MEETSTDKESKKARKPKPEFDPKALSADDKESYEFVKRRLEELKKTREDVYGINLNTLFNDADKEYVPHRLRTKGKSAFVEDETKGWRGSSSMVHLGADDWQSDISQANPYVKIQTALSILVDQNPSGVFTPTSKRYQATTELIKQLYQRSWEYAKSKQQLKLFVFNLAKYGWAVGRTYPLRIERNVKKIKEFNEEEPDKSVYEDTEVCEFNDIFRENIDPRNAWLDDMAKPNNNFSVRDWAWRKVYSKDAFKEEFGNWARADMVQLGGTTTEQIDQTSRASSKTYQDKELIEVYFYENRLKDLFVVLANGVPVVISPLPISDGSGNKKLSLWQTYWNLRHAECPYGIGIYEAIRYDQALLDRIRNMTIDQLTLSIYKMFFYQGTQALTDTGEIRIAPGVGRQALDPKNISWLQVPGPGAESWQGLDVFRKDLDEASGITDPLMGQITGKTAFEIAQAKEAALKRLKTPLDNITDALSNEGYITVSLIQLLYSIPETYQVSDPRLIDDYMKEIQSDPELYSRDTTEAKDGTTTETFTAKVYPEFPLNLEKDEKGTLIETEETQFFRVKPAYLQWEGIVTVKAQSVLSPSKQIDKALDLEMYNMLIPLFAQPPELYFKVAKSIVKLYDKDPRDVLPDAWIAADAQSPEDAAAQQQQDAQNQPLIIPQEQAQQMQQPEQTPMGQMPNQQGIPNPEADKMIAATQMKGQSQTLAGRIMGRVKNTM